MAWATATRRRPRRPARFRAGPRSGIFREAAPTRRFRAAPAWRYQPVPAAERLRAPAWAGMGCGPERWPRAPRWPERLPPGEPNEAAAARRALFRCVPAREPQAQARSG